MMDRKRKAIHFGYWGENLAVIWLRLKGYRIVARNLRTRAGEIDIIARRGKILCFIEVKSRPTRQQALECFSPRQQKRILGAAEAFLSANQRYADWTVRFDFIAITPTHRPQHLINAWYDDR